MYKTIFLSFFLGVLFTINTFAQSQESKKSAPEPIIKEESGKVFAPAPIPDVKTNVEKELIIEEEIQLESPATGEPVIGAEVFEEQNPAQPVESKKADPKTEKEKKPDSIIYESDLCQ